MEGIRKTSNYKLKTLVSPRKIHRYTEKVKRIKQGYIDGATSFTATTFLSKCGGFMYGLFNKKKK